jgi:hypothetical protein
MVFTVRDLDVRGPARRRPAAPAPTRIPAWRWISFITVIAAITHHKLHAQLAGPSLEELLAASCSALVPVHSGFAAWGVILLVLLGYAAFQLLADQRAVPVYDRVSRQLVLTSLLASLLLLALPWHAPWSMVTVTCALAVVAGSAYVRVHHAVAERRGPSWIGIPFALLFGFTVVIAIAGLDGLFATAGSWPAIALLVGAGLVVVALGLHHRDPALPAFVAWLITGISAANRAAPVIAGCALLVAGACAATAILVAVTRAHRQPDDLRRPHRVR